MEGKGGDDALVRPVMTTTFVLALLVLWKMLQPCYYSPLHYTTRKRVHIYNGRHYTLKCVHLSMAAKWFACHSCLSLRLMKNVIWTYLQEVKVVDLSLDCSRGAKEDVITALLLTSALHEKESTFTMGLHYTSKCVHISRAG